MTDKEIKKALECCTPTNESCLNCPLINVSVPKCAEILYKETLDLINRQQTEIERLTINMNAFGLGMKREKEKADTIKAEAIKEFVERLRFEIVNKPSEFLAVQGTVDFLTGMGHRQHEILDDIDNLVKEMVGEQDV